MTDEMFDFYMKQQRDVTMKECHIMEDSFEHKNIVKIIDFAQNKYVRGKDDDDDNYVWYAVYEYIQGRELFDIINLSGTIQENQARYFFYQLIDGLKYCHQNNLCHRDIKMENLMISHYLQLKIIDFGFASDLGEFIDNGQILKTQLGTMGYQAPEVIYGFDYNGQAVDLFAAGVVLFIMVFGRQPFNEAKKDDPCYYQIAQGNIDFFW